MRATVVEVEGDAAILPVVLDLGGAAPIGNNAAADRLELGGEVGAQEGEKDGNEQGREQVNQGRERECEDQGSSLTTRRSRAAWHQCSGAVATIGVAATKARSLQEEGEEKKGKNPPVSIFFICKLVQQQFSEFN